MQDNKRVIITMELTTEQIASATTALRHVARYLLGPHSLTGTEKVLYLVPEADWEACRDAIVAAQVWCDNPTDENAANAAYAAYAAAYAAAAAVSARDDALLEILRFAQDECERLTNHIAPACDLSRLNRLGELVGFAK